MAGPKAASILLRGLLVAIACACGACTGLESSAPESAAAPAMTPDEKVAACNAAHQEENANCGPFPAGSSAATASAHGYKCDSAKHRVELYCS
jgi:hypothetical protein